MIDGNKALEIANEEGLRRGWGAVSSERYEACPFDSMGKRVWMIDLKDRMIIGKRVRFTIDADSGAILESRRMGTR